MKKLFLLLFMMAFVGVNAQYKVAISTNSVEIRDASNQSLNNVKNLTSMSVRNPSNNTTGVVTFYYEGAKLDLLYSTVASVSVSGGAYSAPTSFDNFVSQLNTVVVLNPAGGGGGGGGGGDASAANQNTGNASLSSIDTKLSSQLTNTQIRATPLPVSGTVAVTNTDLDNIDAKTPSLGQATSANSSPVVIASDQAPVNTILTSSASAAAAGIKGTYTAYGYLRTANEPTVQFSDSFDGAIDTVDKWTQVGTVTSTNSAAAIGNVLTTSTVHSLTSKPTFPSLGISFQVLAWVGSFETNPLATTNVNRYYGFHTHTGTPTVAQPATNGVGLEWDATTSKLWLAVYQSGVRSPSSVDLTAFVQAGNTRYAVLYRSDLVIAYIGSSEIPVASISFVTPDLQNLPVKFQTVIGASTPSTTPLNKISAVAEGDTGGNASQISDGTNPFRKMKISANGEPTMLLAAAQTLATVTTVGTVTTTGTLTTLANGQTAHSAASTGSPLRGGGRVKTANDITLVAGDVADNAMTTDGAQVFKPFAVPELDWTFACTAPVANTTDLVLKTAVASNRNYITGFQITNASATIPTEVVIKDGSTVLWRGYVGANTVLNSAVGVTLSTPLKSTVNTALNFACITTGASVYVNTQGYVAP